MSEVTTEKTGATIKIGVPNQVAKPKSIKGYQSVLVDRFQKISVASSIKGLNAESVDEREVHRITGGVAASFAQIISDDAFFVDTSSPQVDA